MRCRLKTILTAASIAITMLVCFESSTAQEICLSANDIKNMETSIKLQLPVTFDKKLRDELLQLRKRDFEQINKTISDRKPEEIVDRLHQTREKNGDSLCGLLKDHGWPTRRLVGDEGAEAAFFL